MIYSDTTTKQGIVQDAYWEAGADANSYPIEHVTRNANIALDEVVALILGADGQWQFDDSNATDLPIGETDLNLGQQDYSFDAEYLTIKSVECSDSSGNWSRLIPIDNNDIGRQQAMSSLSQVNGNPVYYDKMGSSLLLYPAPSYNRRLVQEGAAGLRVYFQRKNNYFATTDTTKEPGFAKHLHKYIPLRIAYAYACAKTTKREASLANQVAIWAKKIMDFYTYREVDRSRRLITKVEVKR